MSKNYDPSKDKDFENKMEQLAEKADMGHDGGKDVRLFFDEMIWVYANIMTKEEYNRMEKEIANTEISGKGYEVYAWNDVSGYSYWKRQGKEGDSNYIQITANIIADPSTIDAKKLKQDIDNLYDIMSHWGNKYEWQEWHSSRSTRSSVMKTLASLGIKVENGKVKKSELCRIIAAHKDNSSEELEELKKLKD